MSQERDYTRRKMEQLAQLIEENLPGDFDTGQLGFFLMIFFQDDEPPRANYISNCKRETIIAAVKEWLSRQK